MAYTVYENDEDEGTPDPLVAALNKVLTDNPEWLAAALEKVVSVETVATRAAIAKLNGRLDAVLGVIRPFTPMKKRYLP